MVVWATGLVFLITIHNIGRSGPRAAQLLGWEHQNLPRRRAELKAFGPAHLKSKFVVATARPQGGHVVQNFPERQILNPTVLLLFPCQIYTG